MKFKFLKGLVASAVVALIGYGVSKSVNNSNAELSELALANIEALAQSEGGWGVKIPCLPATLEACGFFATDAEGNTGWMIIYNSRNAG